MEFAALLVAVVIKSMILFYWEKRKTKRANPGLQTIVIRKPV